MRARGEERPGRTPKLLPADAWEPRVPRRSVLAVSLALATLLVAAAPAPTPRPGDACRDAVDDPPQACTLVRAVTDDAAASCRRVGVGEACAVVDGQDVSEDAVARFEASAVAELLALQRRLQDDLPLRHAVFPATHNSYNSLAYDPTLSRLDANQTVTMRDQLRLGMRRLELDVHWWFAADGSRVPVTCHATDEPNVLGDPVTRHTGCTTEDHVAVGLAEIARWLAEHPREVVMLRFETHLEGVDGHDALATAVEEHLGGRLFRPDGPGCVELPLDLTVAQVRASGAQVIAIGGCGDGSAAWQAAAFDDDRLRVESTYEGAPYAFPDCGGTTTELHDSRWTRWFEDATVVSSMSSLGGTAPTPVTAEVVAAWTRCGVNQPSLDLLTPDDDRLAALVWSFDPGAPTAVDGACAKVGADGGLDPVPCEGPHRAWTCVGDLGATTTDAHGPWHGGDEACAREGRGRFATPRTGREAALLATGPGGPDAWVSLRRVEGEWRLGCAPGRDAGPVWLDTRPSVSCPES